MAIYALGATRARPSEQIIQAALEEGIRDKDGRPFEIIELISLEPVADYTSVHGYEDTFVKREGKKLSIFHRKPGRIRWMQGEFGGMPRAQLAKTPHNVRVLALNYFDKKFKVKDPLHDAEIKAIADKEWAAMTDEQRVKEKARISGLDEAPYGGKKRNSEGKTKDEIYIEELEKDLRKRQRTVDQKELDVNAKEKNMAQKVSKAVEEGQVLTKHTRQELAPLPIHKVRKIARNEFKIQWKDTDKKTEIIEMIMKAQGDVPAPEEAVTVAG
jgi:hypothetical protein